MSEDDLRARVDGLEHRFDRTDDKLDKMDGKIDAMRRELQSNSREAHSNMYERIQQNEQQIAEFRPVVIAAKKHMETDTSFESGWNNKVSSIAIAICAAFATSIISAIVGWVMRG
ncbi:hypothetical protein [Cloacibacillus evryensis]|uniref:hypothetical protein n=1 Tax=Cloacibacillus evryensis TaxID=508460 RepID=UPI002673E36B|nr:hypothetical protein [Cloacibacillus evryensis]